MLGTVFNMSPHSGQQQSQTQEMQEHAQDLRKSAWETGLAFTAWLDQSLSSAGRGPGLTYSAPPRRLASIQPGFPSRALPLSCPLLPGANPFTTALEALTSHSAREKEHEAFDYVSRHFSSLAWYEVLGTRRLSQAWGWVPSVALGEF